MNDELKALSFQFIVQRSHFIVMSRLFLFALALFASAGGAFAQVIQTQPAQPAATPGPKAAAPKFEPLTVFDEGMYGRELKELDGAPLRLDEYRGRVLVINLWATWCGPCRAEIPGLNRVYADYSARGVEFLGLTTENPEADTERVRKFAREFEMKYRLGWLDRDTALLFLRGRNVIPQTIVVAADGRVALHFRGYSEKAEGMVREGLERALNPQAARPATPPAAPNAPGRP